MNERILESLSKISSNWGTGDSLFGQFSQLEDSKEGQEIVKCLGTQEILSSAAVASKSHCFKRPE